MKCNICNKLGHLSTNCPKISTDHKSKSDTDNDKSVMTLNSISNTNNDKYLINVKLNDQLSQGYVDLGSQCTLIKYSEAKRLGIKWTMGPLPTMRGIGNNVILALGKAILKIEIQHIIETIEAYLLRTV